MAEQPAPVPGWLRLLERPRRLHRLATGGLLLGALVAGLDSYARSTPGGAQPDVYALTVLFDALAWALVAASAVAEAYVAGLSAPRVRAGGRPHYLIVLVVGLIIAGVLCATLSVFNAARPYELGPAGRAIKAAVAGMLPLVVGVALTAGLTILWVERLRPRLEARLEAQVRDYERRRERGA
jgi:hypothetical protein